MIANTTKKKYCTVEDHYHTSHESVIKMGKWMGHAACPPCFIKHSSDAVDTLAKKQAWLDKLKTLICPKCKVGWKRCEDPEAHRAKPVP